MAFFRMQTPHTEGRDEKRHAIEDEGELIAELRDRCAAEKGSYGERHPTGRLGKRVCCVKLFFASYGGQYCRAAAGKKGRSQHEQRAQQIQQPGLLVSDCGDEAQGDNGARQVARDHDTAPVEAIEQYAGKGSSGNCGNGTRQHNARDHRAAVRIGNGKAEYCDVVEVIANLANDLPHPHEAIVAVACKQLGEIGHGYIVLLRRPDFRARKRLF